MCLCHHDTRPRFRPRPKKTWGRDNDFHGVVGTHYIHDMASIDSKYVNKIWTYYNVAGVVLAGRHPLWHPGFKEKQMFLLVDS